MSDKIRSAIEQRIITLEQENRRIDLELAKFDTLKIEIESLIARCERAEAKAAKWDDPQTQAKLELAEAVIELFNQEGYCTVDYLGNPQDDESCGTAILSCDKKLLNWFRDQKEREK